MSKHRVNYFVYVFKTDRHAAFMARHMEGSRNKYMLIANSDLFDIVAHSISREEANKLSQDIRKGIIQV